MKKRAKKEVRLKKLDQTFKKIGKTLEDHPIWQEWLESGGPEFLERASRELDEIKPPLEEMLLDLVEAGWVLENPDGDYSFLAKKKKDIVTALWKLTQIIKGHYKSGQPEKEEWRRRLDG